MTDAVLSVVRGREEAAGSLPLGDRPLHQVLEPLSLETLTSALREGSDADDGPIMLFTRDGRTLEAALTPGTGGVEITLHDVSRHVHDAEGFARMALQLHRQNRDLQTLYEATSALTSTLDLPALLFAAAEAIGGYLRADRTLVTVAGHEQSWSSPAAGPSTADLAAVRRDLATARGSLGTVTWWRDRPPDEDEARVVDVLLRKAAVSIDHALLLAPPSEERDEYGLMPPSTARRLLAGYVRPFGLAMITATDGDLESLASGVRPGRTGDVQARWGRDRILVALYGADDAVLQGWLERHGVVVEEPGGRWVAGVARAAADIDQAIELAAAALDAVLPAPARLA